MLTASITLDDRSVIAALRPESERSLPRTSVRISEDGGGVRITISADDTTAMRAALNSYLGWIRITENIDEILR